MAIRQPADPAAQYVQLEGDLLEIDYRARTARVWDQDGGVTSFQFSDDQEGSVDAMRRKRVVVRCRKAINPTGQCILESIVTVFDDSEFWNPPSLEEIIQRQGVMPIRDPMDIDPSVWADEDEDEFLDTLRRWRREG